MGCVQLQYAAHSAQQQKYMNVSLCNLSPALKCFEKPLETKMMLKTDLSLRPISVLM